MRALLATGLVLLLGCQDPAPLISQPRPTSKPAPTPVSPATVIESTVAFRVNYRLLSGARKELTAFGKPASIEYGGERLRCIQWLEEPEKLLCADMNRIEDGRGELVYFYKGEKTNYIIRCKREKAYHWNGCK